MNLFKPISFILSVIFFFFILGCEKEVPQHDIDIEIQQLMEEHDLPSISACVIHENEIVWEKSYGYSNKELQLEASDQTIYLMASVSKLVIATAVMQLVEQGLLDIDQDINNFIPISIRNPNFPEIPITARMLLTHSAGIAWPQTYEEARDLWKHFGPDMAPAPSEWVPQFLIPSGSAYNSKIWKNTAPGTFELYSNIGSNVLAYIVEQISGENFRTYCRSNIFLPLDMQNTSFNYGDLKLEDIAIMYDVNYTIFAPYDVRIYASEGLKTSVQDLSKFLLAYLDPHSPNGNIILREDTKAKMFEIQNESSGICLIWRAGLGGWFGHTGGTDGASTVAEIHPESKTGFIIFCNKRTKLVYPGNEIYGLVRQKANAYID